MKVPAALAFAILVLLSGCAADGDTPTADTPEVTPETTSPGSPTPSETQTTSDTPTRSPTPDPTPTSTPTPVPPDNPWASETVTVTFHDRSEADRDFAPQIEAAIDYWNGRTPRYSEYNVSFSFEPQMSISEADLAVIATEPIRHCANVTEVDSFAGCYRHEHRFDVYVNQSNLQFRNTAIHEFGHALGLQHDDEPHWIMASEIELEGSVTDARDRSNPWNKTGTLGVAVGERLDSGRYEMELEDAVDYYNANQQYRPENVELTVVENPDGADIVVGDSSETSFEFDGAGSVGSTTGLDYDSDEEFEQYTRAYIYLNEVDPEDSEYHFGYWTGYHLGNSEDELPSRYR